LSDPDQRPLSHEYSRAFEALVGEGDEPDIVGLLAYSLFKASIRERVRSGQDVPRHLRNPTSAEIDAYRGQAVRILERYGEGAIAEATPDIIESARTGAKAEILGEVDKVRTTVIERTRAWSTIGYGIVAWFISIVITVVITLAAPGWVMNLVSHISPPEATAPAGEQRPR
jgi:hypothetical protein